MQGLPTELNRHFFFPNCALKRSLSFSAVSMLGERNSPAILYA